MALIKCEECGQMVSEKATSCPSCGAPIEPKVVCKECGATINAGLSTCPNCGCPCDGSTPNSTPNFTPIVVNQQQSPSEIKITLLDLQLTNTGETGRSRIVFAISAFTAPVSGIHWFHIGKVGTGIANILTFIFCPLISFLILGSSFDLYGVSTIGIFFAILFLIPPFILLILTYFISLRVLFMSQEQFEEQYVNSDSFFPI